MMYQMMRPLTSYGTSFDVFGWNLARELDRRCGGNASTRGAPTDGLEP
jgi:hypothetical protein